MARYRLRGETREQHRHVCWRGRAEAACAALYPRPDEAMDAHEQRIPGTHGQDLRPAGEKRPLLDRRTEAYAQPPKLLCLLLIIVRRGAMAVGCRASSRWPIRPGAYGRFGPRCGVATVVRPRALMVQQAAVGATSFIDYLPQCRRRTRICAATRQASFDPYGRAE